MQIRPSVSRKVHLENIVQLHHPDYKGYCLQYNHMTLKSSTFQARRLHLQMLSAKSYDSYEMELKGLDFTIHELTQYMTLIQV